MALASAETASFSVTLHHMTKRGGSGGFEGGGLDPDEIDLKRWRGNAGVSTLIAGFNCAIGMSIIKVGLQEYRVRVTMGMFTWIIEINGRKPL